MVKEENPVKEKNPVKEEDPVKPKDVTAHQKEVSVDPKPNPSQSAAWRTFWLKVRELNTREWGHPIPEAAEGDSLAVPGGIDSEDVPTPPA